MSKSKECYDCKEIKDVTEFKKSCTGGHTKSCRECITSKQKKTIGVRVCDGTLGWTNTDRARKTYSEYLTQDEVCWIKTTFIYGLKYFSATKYKLKQDGYHWDAQNKTWNLSIPLCSDIELDEYVKKYFNNEYWSGVTINYASDGIVLINIGAGYIDSEHGRRTLDTTYVNDLIYSVDNTSP